MGQKHTAWCESICHRSMLTEVQFWHPHKISREDMTLQSWPLMNTGAEAHTPKHTDLILYAHIITHTVIKILLKEITILIWTLTFHLGSGLPYKS